MTGKRFFLWLALLVTPFSLFSQIIKGKVTESGKPLSDVLIVLDPGAWQAFTSTDGSFVFKGLKPGVYMLQANSYGFQTHTQEVTVSDSVVDLEIGLELVNFDLAEVEIEGRRTETAMGMARLSAVDGVAIYSSKKNEVILPTDLNANKATNNARQVYAKVPGLNIWESDQAGVQLGIGARGLSPNRTSNFNTRQNGYDIAADALGYPESYYTPPVEALERIEIVRGAASLQYGTQFGGMLNFVLKQPQKGDHWEYRGRTTGGSYGLLSTFHGFYARKGKTAFSGYYQYKQSEGWRPNSSLDQHTAYASLTHDFNKRWSLSAELTHMHYLAQQPGGLTDAEFEDDPTQSKRSRNWFRVNWNIVNVTFKGNINEHTKIDVRNFGLLASREALGDLSRINRQDIGGNRTYILGEYRNIGNESRVLRNYKLFGSLASGLVGFRLYRGYSRATQGDANDGTGADFSFLNPDDPEGSDYDFPSTNIAVFTEHIFRPTHRLTITPGLRFEYIRTDAEGYYKQITRNFAGEVVAEQVFPESRELSRQFLFGGVGVGYRLKGGVEVYTNISQNYRAITFSDIRIDNPNIVVDSNISDEFGYNADVGLRGNLNKVLFFDLSAFYLAYNNRIGFVTQVDQSTFLEQRLRTNVGDSRSYGVESFVELDFYKLLIDEESVNALSGFLNVGWIEASYIRSDVPNVEGKNVELVPYVNLKTGVQARFGAWSGTVQYSYIAAQFTDAFNTTEAPVTAISGEIPAYQLVDLSVRYQWRFLELEGGITNLLNETYFTRRATGYPGPGVIPADPRMFYATFGWTFGKSKKAG